tara:strand:+ start:52 stop:354 length:303 start_codon:yes stop_codon:yes gene_type:complete
MFYYVYLLKSEKTKSKEAYTYVGYTKNLQERIKKHNDGKGAKFTRGRKWVLIYYEIYTNKILAMKREYRLKNNKKLRDFIKKNVKKNSCISFSILKNQSI